MKPYPKYKDREEDWIGPVPAHWEVKRLANFGEFLKGRGISKADLTEEGLPAITYGDLYTRYSNVITHLEKFVPEKVAKVAEPLRKGDLLFTGSGETPEDIGRCAAFMADTEAYAGGDINIYRQDDNDSRFLSYCLNTPGADQEKARMSKGQIIVHIYKAELRELKFPCPPLAEQRKIAAYLDHTTALIDQLITKNEQLITLLDQQRKAIINEAVTKGLDPKVKMKDSGVEWLGEVPEGWIIYRLKQISEVAFSSVDRKENSDELSVGVCHYPIAYKNEFITKDTALDNGKCTEVELERYGLTKGRIILTKDSESKDDIGIPAFVQENIEASVCGYHLALVDVLDTNVDPEFLFRYLQSDRVMGYYSANSYGVTRYGLGKPIIENLLVPFPPIQHQREIAQHINEASEVIHKVKTDAAKVVVNLKLYRQSMISEAVTGKIDLREWEPAPLSLAK